MPTLRRQPDTVEASTVPPELEPEPEPELEREPLVEPVIVVDSHPPSSPAKRRLGRKHLAMFLIGVLAAASVVTWMNRGTLQGVAGRAFCGGIHEIYETPDTLAVALTQRLEASDACGLARLYPVTQFKPRRHIEVKRWDRPTPLHISSGQGNIRWIRDSHGRLAAVVVLKVWGPSGESPDHWHIYELVLLD